METKYRDWIWIVLLVTAVLGHLWLAATPFTQAEAIAALGALEGNAAPVDSALLFASQVLHFNLFGVSEVTARLLPALAGIVLVMLPWFWRERLGQAGALTTSFVTLLSPLTLYASRRVDSTVLSLCAVGLFATGFVMYLDSRKGAKAMLVAGTAMMLTGGPLVWDMLIAAGIVWLVLRWQNKEAKSSPIPFAELKVPLLIGVALAAAAVVWTGVFGGWDSLMHGLSSWWVSWSAPAPRYGPLTILSLYEPALLLAGMTALIAGVLPKTRTRFSWALSLFTLVLAFLLLIRPGSANLAVSALALPLSVLIGLAVQRWLDSCPRDYHKWNLMHIAGAFAFWLPVLLVLTRHASGTILSVEPPALILVGALILIAIQALLGIVAYLVVPLAWIARNMLAGLVVFLLLVQVSYATNLAFVRGASPAEPVVDVGGSEDLRVLTQVLETLGAENGHSYDTVPIAIIDDGTDQADAWVPLVRWALHDYAMTTVAEGVAADYSGYVITPELEQVSPMLAGRRGMRFTAASQYMWPVPACVTVIPPECSELASWLLYRDLAQPAVQHSIILWAP